MTAHHMTSQEFEKVVGHPPEQDDLARTNCSVAGTPGHLLCGICRHGVPKFTCKLCITEVIDVTWDPQD